MDDNLHDNQVSEALETLSLTDLPIAQDHGVIPTFHEHQNPSSSSPGEDYFEFFTGGLSDHTSDEKMMLHAEDIIFCGKLITINEQQPSQQSEKHHRRNRQNQPSCCRRSRSESMAEIKRTTVMSPLVRNSRSLDYKKMKRNSSMSSEPATEISRDGSGKKSSSSSSSSRWYVLFFGLVKVPPSEMDIRDIKNRRVRRSSSKTPLASSESFSVPQQKCSWRVLGFLSCKSSSSAAVTTPAGYNPKVRSN